VVTENLHTVTEVPAAKSDIDPRRSLTSAIELVDQRAFPTSAEIDLARHDGVDAEVHRDRVAILNAHERSDDP
jgi:hypothetical protein